MRKPVTIGILRFMTADATYLDHIVALRGLMLVACEAIEPGDPNPVLTARDVLADWATTWQFNPCDALDTVADYLCDVHPQTIGA